MIIYADVVLFVNFFFNAELLMLLCKLKSRKIRPVRLIISSLAGGGLSLVAFVPYFQPYLSAVTRYTLPFLMCYVCISPCSFKEVFGGGVLVFFLSFMLSGIINFFGISGIFAAFAVMPLIFFCKKYRPQIKKGYKKTVLCYRGKNVSVEGFCDSGNLLMYSGKPVILAKAEVFAELFGEGFNIAAAGEWIDKCDLRYIPYISLGKKGMLPGVLIDRVIISGRVFDNVILGYAGSEFAERLILSSIMF